MIATIKNGQLAKKSFVLQSKKKACENILNVLWNEGFILGYKISKTDLNTIKIFLKYQNGIPVISLIKILSKPSLRIYYSAKQLWKLDPSKGTIILSTNKGFMSNYDCKKKTLGGEPLILVK
jgi:small subunit ribosomal protein S8